MEPIDYWTLCSELSIVQASLLFVGYDPADYQDDVEKTACPPAGYLPTRTALVNAIRVGRLEADVVEYGDDFGRSGELNPHATTIHVADLSLFFESKGFRCPQFERPVTSATGSAQRRYFSRKLDAANKAWAAVTSDPTRLRGRSPKQALQQWLIEHADELGLTKDGRLNKTAIEEICKVANWRPEGGAPSTPSSDPSRQPDSDWSPAPHSAGRRESFTADLDDEIPF